MLLWNVFLALLWAALTGSFRGPNLALGFALGFVALWLVSRTGRLGSRRYASRSLQAIGFAGFFLWEMLVSSLRVAWHVLQWRPKFSPAIVAVPLDVKTDAEITVLANLICLTPGTLSIDVSTDRTTLYVHALDVPGGDVEALRASIKHGLERRVMEVFAP